MKTNEPFIQGPISTAWMARASKIGKSKGTTVIGLLCWHAYYLNKKQQPIKITKKTQHDFGVERHTFYRALKKLEGCGLIEVQRKRGALPKIKIIGTELAK